jgi:DNA primase catalytic subunit
MALTKEQRREIMGYFMAGRLTVQSVVEKFRRYPHHRYRHQMWDRRFLFYVEDCFRYLSESKMIELLRGVIADEPVATEQPG